jgi:hypothetical protein
MSNVTLVQYNNDYVVRCEQLKTFRAARQKSSICRIGCYYRPISRSRRKQWTMSSVFFSLYYEVYCMRIVSLCTYDLRMIN